MTERVSPGEDIIRPDIYAARRSLKPRPAESHKGTFGHALIIAGSFGMAGAAIMAAMACLRSGTGLVTVACPKSIVSILQTVEPCAICVPLQEKDGVVSIEALDAVNNALKGKTAVVIGPGLTRRVPAEIIKAALISELPAVIDADALNIISDNGELKELLRPRHVITPHPGEARRLLNREIPSALDRARALRELGATVVLKDARSIIIGERTYINTAGCAGLAKGGSGDVLSGILGGLLAQGYTPTDAAWMASVFLGALGEITAGELGQTAMTARDLISHMPRLWGDGRI